MKESWSTRWYTPLLLLAGTVLLALIGALGVAELLTSEAPHVVASRTWTTPLGRAEQALDEADLAAALAWWREARAAALRSGGWEGMVDVADVSRRFGADGTEAARRAYLTALLRARRQRSLDGLLRAAAGFGALGDREVLAHALRLAEREAGADAVARERVRVVADRWMTPPLEAEHRDPTKPGGRRP
jgi:hypothetical protein